MRREHARAPHAGQMAEDRALRGLSPEGSNRATRRAGKSRAKKTGVAATVSVSVASNEDVAIIGSTSLPPDEINIIGAIDFAQDLASVPSQLPAEGVYHRIGQLTRTLHDALRELGYDKDLMATREHLPDARDRLAYIARVTGEAAEKVLNAVDRARTVQQQLAQRAQSLRTRWRAVSTYTGGGSDTSGNAARATPAGRQLIDETSAFFDGVGGQADATQAILTDIMLAQDFHDLTGQVIRKVVALAQNIEEQLVKLLLESAPRGFACAQHERLDGPVVNTAGRDDVVNDQAGVDDLLASLGF